MRSSLLTNPCSTKHPPAQSIADDLVELLLEEIMQLCGESCATRRHAVSGSIEWHKCNGEILAYSRLTQFIEQLSSASGGCYRRSPEETKVPNSVHRRSPQDPF